LKAKQKEKLGSTTKNFAGDLLSDQDILKIKAQIEKDKKDKMKKNPYKYSIFH
jgi:hypothetical protein